MTKLIQENSITFHCYTVYSRFPDGTERHFIFDSTCDSLTDVISEIEDSYGICVYSVARIF